MDLGLAQHVPTNPNWCHGTLSQLLPLTGLSCSLDRCHADLDQDQAAPAVSQWTTVGLPLDPDADSNHPMDFGISPKPPTAYRARTLRNWATPAGGRKDNLGGVRAFPQPKSPRAQEPTREVHRNVSLRFDQVRTQSLGHLGLWVGTRNLWISNTH